VPIIKQSNHFKNIVHEDVRYFYLIGCEGTVEITMAIAIAIKIEKSQLIVFIANKIVESQKNMGIAIKFDVSQLNLTYRN